MHKYKTLSYSNTGIKSTIEGKEDFSYLQHYLHIFQLDSVINSAQRHVKNRVAQKILN